MSKIPDAFYAQHRVCTILIYSKLHGPQDPIKTHDFVFKARYILFTSWVMSILNPFSSLIKLSSFEIYEDLEQSLPDRSWSTSKRYIKLLKYQSQTKQKIKAAARQIEIICGTVPVSDHVANMGVLFKQFWKVGVELGYMENMVRHHAQHVSLSEYIRAMEKCVEHNQVTPDIFPDTEEYKYEAFTPVVGLARMDAESVISWLFNSMPAVVRTERKEGKKEYLCPYCDVVEHKPRFYTIEKYKKHLCFAHGVIHKGMWIRPPVILKNLVGDCAHQLKHLLVCPDCHDSSFQNSIYAYNRHYATHHLAQRAKEENGYP